MPTLALVPKQKHPEPHQLAAIIIAKASRQPIPEKAKPFAHLIKKVRRKKK